MHVTLVSAERHIKKTITEKWTNRTVRCTVHTFMNMKNMKDFTALIKTPAHTHAHSHTHRHRIEREGEGEKERERCCISWETTWETWKT